MRIQYLGHSAFLLKDKETRICMDPFNPTAVGLKFPKIEAEIVTVSHGHEDHNYVQGVGPSPVVFDFPGEYECRGIKVFGYQSFHDDKNGEARGENVVFSVILNDIKVTHLGDLGSVPSGELLAEIEDTDILLLPVGGVYTINPAQAVETMRLLNPKVTIPMHFKTDKHGQTFAQMAGVGEFLKLIDKENLEPVNKYEVKAEEDLPESEVVLLTF